MSALQKTDIQIEYKDATVSAQWLDRHGCWNFLVTESVPDPFTAARRIRRRAEEEIADFNMRMDRLAAQLAESSQEK